MEQKVALVTGASSGIGKAIAIKLAQNGYAVALGCRNTAAAEEVADFIRTAGGTVMVCPADVTDSASVEAMVAAAQTMGRIELLVPAAGIAYQNLFQYTDEETFDRIMDTNVKGAYLTAKAVLPHMITAQSGKIVFLSSMWGEVGASCEVVYSASKAALIGLTKALAKEVGPAGIRVNCVSPGVIRTPMTTPLGEETLTALAEETPLGRIGRPEEVANAVLFLASDASAFITGQILGVNGGFIT
ncbi:MAG: 3-oxoacyl-ACP reductase FabG [Clostridia bacterium]|nr:3-oxoacyl-ACP reductase FabG [Clostridia bacterium]